jgi:hypothetical protein
LENTSSTKEKYIKPKKELLEEPKMKLKEKDMFQTNSTMTKELEHLQREPKEQ